MKLLDVNEIVSITGSSRERVYDWIHSGILKAAVIGKGFKVREKDFEDFLEWSVGRDLNNPFTWKDDLNYAGSSRVSWNHE